MRVASPSFISLLARKVRVCEEDFVAGLGNTDTEKTCMGGTDREVRRRVGWLVKVIMPKIARQSLGRRGKRVVELAIRSENNHPSCLTMNVSTGELPGPRSSDTACERHGKSEPANVNCETDVHGD